MNKRLRSKILVALSCKVLATVYRRTVSSTLDSITAYQFFYVYGENLDIGVKRRKKVIYNELVYNQLKQTIENADYLLEEFYIGEGV